MRTALFALPLVVTLSVSVAVASSKTITGKLSKKGYTVVALAYNGKTATDSAPNGSFSVKAPGSKVTLQLINAKGRYAGAIIVAKKGKQVVEGVKAGAKLGTVKVLSGYARPTRKLATGFIDFKRVAQAKGAGPLGGGGNFGLVVSKKRSKSGAGRDQDLDGVPDILDIDKNGNLVLNDIDGEATSASVLARTAADAAAPTASSASNLLFSQLTLGIAETVNANASAITDAEINAAMESELLLTVGVPEGDLVEMDCGGLSYCSSGGTGTLQNPANPGITPGEPFPSCCDPDGNGFGNLRGPDAPTLTGTTGNEFFLEPHASSSSIGSGDTFITRVTNGGTLTETSRTVNFVFITVPALVSYTDDAGHSGSITYPGTPATLGSDTNPIPVSAGGSSGDVVVNGTYWRSQRRGIASAGESAFVDIGGLDYSVQMIGNTAAGSAAQCPASTLSTTDPNLTISGSDIGTATDKSADQNANPANTLQLSVNVTQCMAAKGTTLTTGSRFTIEFEARAGSQVNHATQRLNFVVQ